MKVGIDLRVLARGVFSGIEVYAQELTRALITGFPDVRFRLFHNALKKERLPEDFYHFANAEIIERNIPNKFFEYFWRTPFVPHIDTLLGGIDVLFSPHFLPLPGRRQTLTGRGLTQTSRHNVPQVMVVHDLSFARHPEFFSLRKRYWHWLVNPKTQVMKADHIIAVSESTKADLIELWNIDSGKVSVIYPGIDQERFRPMPKDDPSFATITKKYNLPEHFILFLGVLEPRKNIIGLIRAFELFVQTNADADYTQTNADNNVSVSQRPVREGPRLVIAGPRGWGDASILQAIKKSRVRDRIHYIGFVPEEDKPALYNLADLFVYPSFFEGFGFPPLEAMACGVPTIVSNRSSLPEVVGDSALMVDPYDVGQMAEVIALLAEDQGLRNYYRGKGLQRAQEFLWENVAQQTMAVFKKFAQK